MKKYYIITPIILSSFFLFISTGHCATVRLTYDTSFYNIFTDSNFISYYQSLTSSNNNYVISLNDNKIWSGTDNFTYSCTYSAPTLRCNPSPSANRAWTRFTLNPFTLGTNTTTGMIITYSSGNSVVLDTSFQLVPSDNNKYIVSVGSDSITCDTSNGCNKLPTLLDLYKLNHDFPPNTLPTPTDDYPLLTDFINITINNLIYITEFITTNYIFLTIFVIFIFYFIIYLFRRLL